MKRVALLLAAMVSTSAAVAAISPRAWPPRAAIPPTDLAQSSSQRTVWSTGEPLTTLVRPDDRLLEVVRMAGPAPRVAPSVEAYLDGVIRTSYIRAVVTVLDLESDPPGPRPSFKLPGLSIPQRDDIYPRLRRLRVRVDEVLSNRPAVRVGHSTVAPAIPWKAGAVETAAYGGGGEFVAGGTTVQVRQDWERLPQRGHRYVWFLGGSSWPDQRDHTASEMVDVTGPFARPLVRLPGWTTRGRIPTPWLLAQVRERSAVLDAAYLSAMTKHREERRPVVLDR